MIVGLVRLIITFVSSINQQNASFTVHLDFIICICARFSLIIEVSGSPVILGTTIIATEVVALVAFHKFISSLCLLGLMDIRSEHYEEFTVFESDYACQLEFWV